MVLTESLAMTENSSVKKTVQTNYPPISDYGFISDCHATALISRAGSIDWSCMPRIDSASCFGRLLDFNSGGYCQIVPRGHFEMTRRYLDKTLILETQFTTESGRFRLVDLLPMRKGGAVDPYRQIIRKIEGLEGTVIVDVIVEPRFDYGAIKPWIKKCSDFVHVAIGGSQGLIISGDFELEVEDRHRLKTSIELNKNEGKFLSISYRPPEALDEKLGEPISAEEIELRFEQTVKWWSDWSSKCNLTGPHTENILRSAIILKGLQNAPTGAIAASATTSLPEAWEGSRNWDYRYSWIRDSVFTVRTLARLGWTNEADGFRRFIERSTAGSASELQILYGIGGERRLHEQVIDNLSGYRNASPVRIGNAAEEQTQLDVYGELLDLSWIWHNKGHSPDKNYTEFLIELVSDTIKKWKHPDQGIWEMRGEPRHFVLSKAMCWVALDRGTKMMNEFGRKDLNEPWKAAKNEIRRDIETNGYDMDRGVFVQAYDCREMDASLLLLPVFGFVDFKDERMIRTVDAIIKDLERDGLIMRYRQGNDELDGNEGAFLACTFWMSECLARQGRYDDATKYFENGIATGNELGLFSEEYDTRTKELMGNFPQGLTHLSFIAAALALNEGQKDK